MIKFNLKFLFGSIIIISGFLVFLNFNQSLAQVDAGDKIKGGLKNTGYQAGYQIETSTGKPKKEIVAALGGYANGMMLALGALFLVLMIYGGYIWMRAEGNEEEIKKAKLIIISATIGLFIILAGRIIAEVIIREFGTAVLGTTPEL